MGTTDGQSGTILSYDAMGRVTTKSTCLPGQCGASRIDQNSSYDLAGNLTSYDHGTLVPANAQPSSFLGGHGLSYDAAGRLQNLTAYPQAAAQASTLFNVSSYGPVGLLNSTLGNGLQETRSYDNRMRQTSYTVTGANALVSATAPYGVVAPPLNDANQSNVVAQGDDLHVQGWAATAGGCPTSSVQIELGATKGGPGMPIGAATLGYTGWRYDQGFTNCGFDFNSSIGGVAPGSYFVNVYGTDAAGNRGLLYNQYPITVTASAAPYGDMGVAATTVVQGGRLSLQGWAIDAQMVAPVSAVKVQVDGEDIGYAQLGVQRPDVVSIVGQGDQRYLNSGFTFNGTIGNLGLGTHSVDVIIYDALGQHTMPPSVPQITVVADTASVAGNIDSTNLVNYQIASGNTLTAQGWALDQNAADCGVNRTVELWLDDSLVAQGVTGGSRPDVAAAFHNPACTHVGWSLSAPMSKVPAGEHAMRVVFYDGTGGSAGLGSVPQMLVTPQGSPAINVATPTVIPTKYAWSVGYEPNGNVGSAYDSVNGNWAYLYDNLNRLVGAGSSQGSALAWDYDSFGNMLTQTVTGGYGMGHQAFYNANNQVLDTCYDAAGNQLKDYGCSSPSEYTYDAESRLSSAFFGQTRYVYDAAGQRVAKYNGGTLTNAYLYDNAGHVVTEFDGSYNVLRREVYAGSRHLGTYDQAGNFTYALTDWLGTERARTDANGNLCETSTSQPFGDNQHTDGTCLASSKFFTGKERDAESGLDFFGSRYYGSSMGRFMSPDPSGLYFADQANPQSLNLYGYVRNNPLNSIDTDGLLTIVLPGTWWKAEDWNNKTALLAEATSNFHETHQTWLDQWDPRGDTDSARSTAASGLRDFINNYHFAPGETLNIVAHSHGGNVALQAAALGLNHRIDTLITLGTPFGFAKKSAGVGEWYNVTGTGDDVQPAGSKGCWSTAGCSVQQGAHNTTVQAGSHSALWNDQSVRNSWWHWFQNQSQSQQQQEPSKQNCVTNTCHGIVP